MSDLTPYWQHIADRVGQTYDDPLLAQLYLERQQAQEDDFGLGIMPETAALPTREELTGHLYHDPGKLRSIPGNSQSAPSGFNYGELPPYRTVIEGIGNGALVEDEDGNIFRRYGARQDSVENLPVFHIDRNERRVRKYNYRSLVGFDHNDKGGITNVRGVEVVPDSAATSHNAARFSDLARGKFPIPDDTYLQAHAGYLAPLFKFLSALSNDSESDEIRADPVNMWRDKPFTHAAGEVAGNVGIGVGAGSAASLAGAPVAVIGAVGAAAPVGIEQFGRVASGHETPLSATGKTAGSAALGAVGGQLSQKVFSSTMPFWRQLLSEAAGQGALAAGDAGLHGAIDLASGKNLRPGSLQNRMLVAGLTGT
ncbi:MAG: hypothetical protein AAFW74_10950, partial [Pseudomonadota bacterium]